MSTRPTPASGMKGFASMNDEVKKSLARKGGLASAKSRKTSNRGFASMDKEKLREISSMGGKASRTGRSKPATQDETDVGRKVGDR